MNISNLKTELGLAVSYLKPKRNAVSVITCISVIGVMLGVAVLIIVLSVMTGFTDLWQQKIMETTSHLRITRYSFSDAPIAIQDPGKVIQKISEKVPGMTLVPATESPVLVQCHKKFEPKMIVGLEPDSNVKIEELKHNLLGNGEFSLEKNEVIVGCQIANQLRLTIGSKILIHSPSKLSKMVEVDDAGKVKVAENAEMSLPMEFTVSGIFKFDKYDFDAQVLFINIDDANDLLDLSWGSASVIYGWVPNPFNMDKEVELISQNLPGYSITDWQTMNQRFLDVLKMEKTMMFFLLIFIVLVAAFSNMNTLITVVVQKTREIGIMKSLGATSASVMRIFIFQGLIVGLIGNVCGIALGILVVIYRNNILEIARWATGKNLFPAEFYYFGGLPGRIDFYDILFIGVTSVILCTLGAVIPALRAASLDPAKALRYE